MYRFRFETRLDKNLPIIDKHMLNYSCFKICFPVFFNTREPLEG